MRMTGANMSQRSLMKCMEKVHTKAQRMILTDRRAVSGGLPELSIQLNEIQYFLMHALRIIGLLR